MSLLTNVLKLWRTGQYLLPADSGFMVKHLFANGEPGFAKLDFSGFAGMYQDRARTIPYTAVEQPLGSFTGLNGVTATAPADVNRGVVSARVNLLTKTEQFDDAVWNKNNVTVTPNATVAPDGTMTADAITTTNNSNPNVYQATSISMNGISFQFSLFVRANTATEAVIQLFVNSGSPGGVQLTGWGIVSGPGSIDISSSASGNLRVHGLSQTEWTQIYIVGTPVSAVGTLAAYVKNRLSGGAVGDSIYIWGASLTLAADSHLPYQRVNTPTDYDTAGFPHYLAFNGTNTAYVTPSIDFTGTDKMTVWAGVTKLSDTPSQMIAEISSVAESQPGSWFLASQYVSYNYFANSLGVPGNGRAIVAFAVPTVSKDFITLQMDLSAPTPAGRLSARRNTSGSANTGVFGYGGNYGNYPLYIGSRAGTSTFFNGRIYSLIVRGAESSISQIEATENLIRKTMRLP